MDNTADAEKLLAALEELREGQKQQLAMQAEALELQRTNVALVEQQFERAKKMQDRAEKMQDSGAQLVATARKSMIVILPIILGLLLFVAWLIFRII
jgi:uncharacterized membrane protein (DUF106 family)